MKFLALTLLALAAVASAKYLNLDDVIDLEDLTAYGYLSKIGAPLAERIRKAEEEADIHGRIAGGDASNLGQFPFQAGLLAQFSGGQGICGGSLITANRVLTAAHCWWDGQNQATSFIVILGTIRLFTGGTRVSSNNVVTHANWNPTQIRNDIAMVRLNSNVGLSININLIALPSGSQLLEDFAGEMAIACGFGHTDDSTAGGLFPSQVLRHIEVPVITNALCAQSFPNFLQSSKICTSGAGGKSVCVGDFGGPLFVKRDGKYILIGVTSFVSDRGCTRGFPAVFTRVTTFINWINSQLP